MADFVHGDYQYTIIDSENNYVKAQVEDSSKSIYEDIPEIVINDNRYYTVTSLENCFINCELTKIPNIPNTIVNMSYCFMSSIIPYIPKFPKKVENLEGCFRLTTFRNTDWEYFGFKNYIPSTVTNMLDCFSNSNIDYCPYIPLSVKNLRRCFYYCNFLKSSYGDVYIASLPEDSRDIFYGTNGVYIVTSTDTGNRNYWKDYVRENSGINIVSNKVLSDKGDYVLTYSSSASCEAWVDKTRYENIPGTIKVDNVNYNVINLNDCFSSCKNIITAPIIPSTASNVSMLFEGCSNLEGNIVVYNEPSLYSDIFTDTIKNIYIYSKNKNANSVWRTIANQYSNVTFIEEENVLEIDKDNLCIGLGQNKTVDTNTVNFNWNTLLKGKFYINNAPLQDLIEQFEWYDVIE